MNCLTGESSWLRQSARQATGWVTKSTRQINASEREKQVKEREKEKEREMWKGPYEFASFASWYTQERAQLYTVLELEGWEVKDSRVRSVTMGTRFSPHAFRLDCGKADSWFTSHPCLLCLSFPFFIFLSLSLSLYFRLLSLLLLILSSPLYLPAGASSRRASASAWMDVLHFHTYNFGWRK